MMYMCPQVEWKEKEIEPIYTFVKMKVEVARHMFTLHVDSRCSTVRAPFDWAEEECGKKSTKKYRILRYESYAHPELTNAHLYIRGK